MTERYIQDLINSWYKEDYYDPNEIIDELIKILADSKTDPYIINLANAKLFNGEINIWNIINNFVIKRDRKSISVKRKLLNFLNTYCKRKSNILNSYGLSLSKFFFSIYQKDDSVSIREISLKNLKTIVKCFEINNFYKNDFLFSKIKLLYEELIYIKLSPGIKSNVLKLFNILFKNWKEDFSKYIVLIKEFILKELKSQIKIKKKPEISLIDSCLRVLKTLINQIEFSVDELKELFGYIKVFLVPIKDINSYNILINNLKLLKDNLEKFEFFFITRELVLFENFITLIEYSNHRKLKEITAKMFNNYFIFLSNKQNIEERSIKYILKKMKEFIKDNNDSIKLMVSVKSFGIFSNYIKNKWGDEELHNYFFFLIEISKNLIDHELLKTGIINYYSDPKTFKFVLFNQKQLSSYLISIAKISLNLNKLSGKEFEHIYYLFNVSLKCNSTYFSNYLIYLYEGIILVIKSLLLNNKKLNNSPLYLFESLLKKLILTEVTENDNTNEIQILNKNYNLIKYILNDEKFLEKEEKDTINLYFFKSFILLLNKLNFDYKKINNTDDYLIQNEWIYDNFDEYIWGFKIIKIIESLIDFETFNGIFFENILELIKFIKLNLKNKNLNLIIMGSTIILFKLLRNKNNLNKEIFDEVMIILEYYYNELENKENIFLKNICNLLSITPLILLNEKNIEFHIYSLNYSLNFNDKIDYYYIYNLLDYLNYLINQKENKLIELIFIKIYNNLTKITLINKSNFIDITNKLNLALIKKQTNENIILKFYEILTLIKINYNIELKEKKIKADNLRIEDLNFYIIFNDSFKIDIYKLFLIGLEKNSYNLKNNDIELFKELSLCITNLCLNNENIHLKSLFKLVLKFIFKNLEKENFLNIILNFNSFIIDYSLSNIEMYIKNIIKIMIKNEKFITIHIKLLIDLYKKLLLINKIDKLKFSISIIFLNINDYLDLEINKINNYFIILFYLNILKVDSNDHLFVNDLIISFIKFIKVIKLNKLLNKKLLKMIKKFGFRLIDKLMNNKYEIEEIEDKDFMNKINEIYDYDLQYIGNFILIFINIKVNDLDNHLDLIRIVCKLKLNHNFKIELLEKNKNCLHYFFENDWINCLFFNQDIINVLKVDSSWLNNLLLYYIENKGNYDKIIKILKNVHDNMNLNIVNKINDTLTYLNYNLLDNYSNFYKISTDDIQFKNKIFLYKFIEILYKNNFFKRDLKIITHLKYYINNELLVKNDFMCKKELKMIINFLLSIDYFDNELINWILRIHKNFDINLAKIIRNILKMNEENKFKLLLNSFNQIKYLLDYNNWIKLINICEKENIISLDFYNIINVHYNDNYMINNLENYFNIMLPFYKIDNFVYHIEELKNKILSIMTIDSTLDNQLYFLKFFEIIKDKEVCKKIIQDIYFDINSFILNLMPIDLNFIKNSEIKLKILNLIKLIINLVFDKLLFDLFLMILIIYKEKNLNLISYILEKVMTYVENYVTIYDFIIFLIDYILYNKENNHIFVKINLFDFFITELINILPTEYVLKLVNHYYKEFEELLNIKIKNTQNFILKTIVIKFYSIIYSNLDSNKIKDVMHKNILGINSQGNEITKELLKIGIDFKKPMFNYQLLINNEIQDQKITEKLINLYSINSYKLLLNLISKTQTKLKIFSIFLLEKKQNELLFDHILIDNSTINLGNSIIRMYEFFDLDEVINNENLKKVTTSFFYKNDDKKNDIMNEILFNNQIYNNLFYDFSLMINTIINLDLENIKPLQESLEKLYLEYEKNEYVKGFLLLTVCKNYKYFLKYKQFWIDKILDYFNNIEQNKFVFNNIKYIFIITILLFNNNNFSQYLINYKNFYTYNLRVKLDLKENDLIYEIKDEYDKKKIIDFIHLIIFNIKNKEYNKIDFNLKLVDHLISLFKDYFVINNQILTNYLESKDFIENIIGVYLLKIIIKYKILNYKISENLYMIKEFTPPIENFRFINQFMKSNNLIMINQLGKLFGLTMKNINQNDDINKFMNKGINDLKNIIFTNKGKSLKFLYQITHFYPEFILRKDIFKNFIDLSLDISGIKGDYIIIILTKIFEQAIKLSDQEKDYYISQIVTLILKKFNKFLEIKSKNRKVTNDLINLLKILFEDKIHLTIKLIDQYIEKLSYFIKNNNKFNREQLIQLFEIIINYFEISNNYNLDNLIFFEFLMIGSNLNIEHIDIKIYNFLLKILKDENKINLLNEYCLYFLKIINHYKKNLDFNFIILISKFFLFFIKNHFKYLIIFENNEIKEEFDFNFNTKFVNSFNKNFSMTYFNENSQNYFDFYFRTNSIKSPSLIIKKNENFKDNFLNNEEENLKIDNEKNKINVINLLFKSFENIENYNNIFLNSLFLYIFNKVNYDIKLYIYEAIIKIIFNKGNNNFLIKIFEEILKNLIINHPYLKLNKSILKYLENSDNTKIKEIILEYYCKENIFDFKEDKNKKLNLDENYLYVNNLQFNNINKLNLYLLKIYQLNKKDFYIEDLINEIECNEEIEDLIEKEKINSIIELEKWDEIDNYFKKIDIEKIDNNNKDENLNLLNFLIIKDDNDNKIDKLLTNETNIEYLMKNNLKELILLSLKTKKIDLINYSSNLIFKDILNQKLNINKFIKTFKYKTIINQNNYIVDKDMYFFNDKMINYELNKINNFNNLNVFYKDYLIFQNLFEIKYDLKIPENLSYDLNNKLNILKKYLLYNENEKLLENLNNWKKNYYFDKDLNQFYFDVKYSNKNCDINDLMNFNIKDFDPIFSLKKEFYEYNTTKEKSKLKDIKKRFIQIEDLTISEFSLNNIDNIISTLIENDEFNINIILKYLNWKIDNIKNDQEQNIFIIKILNFIKKYEIDIFNFFINNIDKINKKILVKYIFNIVSLISLDFIKDNIKNLFNIIDLLKNYDEYLVINALNIKKQELIEKNEIELLNYLNEYIESNKSSEAIKILDELKMINNVEALVKSFLTNINDNNYFFIKNEIIGLLKYFNYDDNIINKFQLINKEINQEKINELKKLVKYDKIINNNLYEIYPNLKNYNNSYNKIDYFFNSNLKIIRFNNYFKEISSLKRPRIVKVITSDFKERNLLFKCDEDLRNDYRIFLIYDYLNNLINEFNENMNLNIYGILPISYNYGIIEWVNDINSIQDFINNPKLKKDNSYELRKTFLKKHSNSSNINTQHLDLLKINNSILKTQLELEKNNSAYRNLELTILEYCNNVDDFLRIKTQFSKKYAVSCIINYILGVGDRHLENILINLNKKDINIYNIDFGYSFDIGINLKIPEITPYRMTWCFKNIIYGYYEYLFKKTSMKIINLIQSKSNDLIDFGEIFLKEPLKDWVMIFEVLNKNKKLKLNDFIQNKFDILKYKIKGYNPLFILNKNLENHELYNQKELDYLKNIFKENKPDFRIYNPKNFNNTLYELSTNEFIYGRHWIGWSPFI